MVRAASATRGGERKAGTLRPASWAAAPSRRAASAKRRAGSSVTVRSFTIASIAGGCDIYESAAEPVKSGDDASPCRAVTTAARRRYDRDIARLAVPALG